MTNENPIACLNRAIELEKSCLTAYERPSEPIAYETLRTLDDLFCRHLMEPSREVMREEESARAIATWGTNHALRRVIPSVAKAGVFRDFPSSRVNQEKADDFIVRCGSLAVAERMDGWLRDGILVGEVRPFPTNKLDNVLVLRNCTDSCYDEEIDFAARKWACDSIWQGGLNTESDLENRYNEIEPILQKNVELAYGWQIRYSCTKEIDDYFSEWGTHYLRRIFSQDLIGQTDTIGGHEFSRWLSCLR